PDAGNGGEAESGRCTVRAHGASRYRSRPSRQDAGGDPRRESESARGHVPVHRSDDEARAAAMSAAGPARSDLAFLRFRAAEREAGALGQAGDADRRRYVEERRMIASARLAGATFDHLPAP